MKRIVPIVAVVASLLAHASPASATGWSRNELTGDAALPQGDIHYVYTDYRDDVVSLGVKVVSPVDLETDLNWGLVWVVDTDDDETSDYSITAGHDETGALVGGVLQPGATEPHCAIDLAQDGERFPYTQSGTYWLIFDASCIGDPASFEVAVWSGYQNGAALSEDVVPEENAPEAHILATTESTTPAAAVPPASAASAASAAVTLSQSAATLKAGDAEIVVASVTLDGSPAPDGTLVHFTLKGNPGPYTITDADLLTGGGVWAVAPHGADGYWMADLSGIVRAFGSAPFLGDLSAVDFTGYLDGIAPTASGNGYWLATTNGEVYAFGDAGSGKVAYGPLGDDWVAGMAPASDGVGYRLITASGRVLPATSALGNTASAPAPLFPEGPAFAIVSTPSGNGYWAYTEGGHIAGFGDAAFYGDTHSMKLNRPIYGMATTPTGRGYWLVDSGGGVFSYGDARFLGSTGNINTQSPVTNIIPTLSGLGYWLVTEMGAIYTFGDASNAGSVFDVPTVNGQAGFAFTSLAPGTTTVTALGPPSLGGTAATSISQTWTPADGYWMVGSDGAVYPFGGAANLGDAKAFLGSHEAVDLEPSPGFGGYWIVDDIGHVFAFGNAAGHLGNADASKMVPGEKVVSISATPTGGGYWIFTSRGRVFAQGDATNFGDMSATTLNGPVLDSIPTPTGNGYYMVGSDGGIFAFGDAKFAGSMGGKPLNAPVQSLVPDSDGVGYWLVASDGGIFAFDAKFAGSMGGKPLNKPVTGMVLFGNGYLMVAEDGGIFNFSNRPFYGSLGGNPPAKPIVSVAVLDPFGS